jgi:magnesium chelatase subunit I
LKLERQEDPSPYKGLIEWFFAETGFELLDDASDANYKKQLDAVGPLEKLVRKYQPELSAEDTYFMKEFVLWGLVEYNKLSKDRFVKGYQFKDIYGSYISKL